MNQPIRTRIAPSPTGENLHIGNAYTAYINFLVAQKYHGSFIVRIEDTDRTRFVEGSESRILASLKWLGITYEEGPDVGGPYAPYRQSERLAEYKKYADVLIAKGHAYHCFCTAERLGEMRKTQEAKHQPPMYDGLCKAIDQRKSALRVKNGDKYVIRLNVPEDGVTTFHDEVRGDISFENKLIDDQVLLKSDGFPTYHLGVVVDDHIMKISHVIRGEEWISSTPKHILLYDYFGWEKPVYAHMSLLRNPDKSKLSKRKNPVWVSWFKEQGFLPEAIINFFGTMAWSFPGNREIYSSVEMMEQFDIARLQATAPVFNLEKLRWMNGEYLRKFKISNLKFKISEFYNGKYTPEQIERILPLVIERMKTLREFESLAGFFFARPKDFERPLDPKLLKQLEGSIATAEWTHEALEKTVRDLADKLGLKAKDVFMELRLAVTGRTVGPPLLESLEILGKKEVLVRLDT